MKILPFKLEPEFREYIWGGSRLRPDAERTAEAWVVYENNLVVSGPFKGKRLKEVALVAGESLLGQAVMKRTGMKFPLLVKLLDSQKWLSLQVHPNDAQAVRWEGTGSFGKMEGWYIIEAEEGAMLLSGFNPGTSQADISDTIGEKDMLEIVSRKAVKKGDAILITPGTIHAIGPGLMVYEVQQTSDITYRVYDWDRPTTEGRKLHIKQALDVLDPYAGGEVVSAEGMLAVMDGSITWTDLRHYRSLLRLACIAFFLAISYVWMRLQWNKTSIKTSLPPL